MNLLLDSHTFLWFVWDDPNLSPTAKTLIEDPANQKFVSVATCWEIAIKAGLKKLALGEPATTFLPRELATNGFGLLGIELAHATFVETLPPHHKDPFDRLLVSQAMIEKLPLVSADAIFDQYGIQRLWLGYRMSQGVDTAYLVSLVTKRVDDHAFVVWYDPEGRSLPAHLKLRSGSACHWL